MLTKSFDILLYPVGTVLFHTFRNMTVNIQCKGCRGEAKIALHRFNIVSVPERQDGVSVSKIMRSVIRSTHRCCQLLEVSADSLRMKMQTLPDAPDRSRGPVYRQHFLRTGYNKSSPLS